MLDPNSKHWDSLGAQEEEEDDDYENSTPPYKDLPPKPGAQEEEEDDDYENSTPPYKDLPPKPGVKTLLPPVPSRPAKLTDLKLARVPSTSPQPVKQSSGDSRVRPDATRPPPPCPDVNRDPPRELPPVPPPDPPLPWLGPKSQVAASGFQLQRLVMLLSLLLPLSLALGGAALLVALSRYQQLVEELEELARKQAAWREDVAGLEGLAGLRKDVDSLQASTNRSLTELRGLLDCSRLTCPENWLPFKDECYYFSQNTRSWDVARAFCQEHFSHLVIVSSQDEQDFIIRARQSHHVYWLGLTDSQQEGKWMWLDDSPVTLKFWAHREPNNSEGDEDCGSLNRDGTWNDLKCLNTNYWICERRCSCG